MSPRNWRIRAGAFPGDIVDRSTLTVGSYEPDATTTGVVPGIALTTYSGNITVTTPNQTFQNLRIEGYVKVQAANCFLKNCQIVGTNAAPSVSTHLVDATHQSVSNLIVEDCEINPQYAHWNWGDGIVGHDYTARRCNVYHMTDCFGVYNTHLATPYATNVIIEACYAHDLGWWTAATTGIIHPSDTESHNDIIQQQGGTGTIIRGNSLRAMYARQYGHWWVTDPTTEPYTTIALHSLADGGPYQTIPDRGNGTLATGRYNYDDLSAIMVNANVGPSYDFDIHDNWFYGGNFCINAGGVTQSGTQNFGSVVRNRFMDHAQGTQGSGGDNTYTVYLGSGWNGHVTNGIGTADQNYYADNGHAINFRMQA